MKEINGGIFRAYDIRGIVDADFDPEWVEVLGKALGTYFKGQGRKRMVVGHDCRHSSPGYQEAMVRGATGAGMDVIFLGQVSTPLFYFAVKKLQLQAGVMITASHNPPEYNGFKVWSGPTTAWGPEIQDIFQVMAAGKFSEGKGLATYHDILPTYLEDLASQARLERPVKVVVDGGNGAGGEITAELLRRIGAEVVELYCEPDGDFPNHHPDPVVEKYVADLQERVEAEGADLGIGLDGDCDRIGVVDETGRLMFGDELLAIYSRDLLEEKSGAVIIGDVKCSHRLFEDIAAHGGEPIMSVTGHSLVKARMIETGAALAGEMSGHMFFADRYYGFDDASYAALRIVQIMGRHPGKPLSSYLADWPATCNTPEIRMDCPEEIKFAVVERAVEHFRKLYDIIDIDGVRIPFKDGWGLVRASNTQPVLVLRFEAESQARLEEIRKLVEEPIHRFIKEMDNN